MVRHQIQECGLKVLKKHNIIVFQFQPPLKKKNVSSKKGNKKKLSKKEKAKLEAEQAETLRIEMERERQKKLEEDRERKIRERRDARKKQEQEAVENKLRRVQLRNSSHFSKSINTRRNYVQLDCNIFILFSFSLYNQKDHGIRSNKCCLKSE